MRHCLTPAHQPEGPRRSRRGIRQEQAPSVPVLTSGVTQAGKVLPSVFPSAKWECNGPLPGLLLLSNTNRLQKQWTGRPQSASWACFCLGYKSRAAGPLGTSSWLCSPSLCEWEINILEMPPVSVVLWLSIDL